MINYLFIESRDPFESRDTRFVLETATALKQRDNEVTVFLIQNGVFGARNNSVGAHIAEMAQAGVRLLADDFSLRERGIRQEELVAAVTESTIDVLVDILISDNTKAIWH
ncbi:MAG TPA: DsrE family protein [Blastocatellia bacterium]|nr:DsrE family protein [Blastocatellia bacterium]